MYKVLLILAIFTLAVQACGSAVPPAEDTYYGVYAAALAYNQAVPGLRAAISGEAGTVAMAKNNLIILIWQYKQLPVFVVLDISTKQALSNFLVEARGNATVMGIDSMGSLVRALQDEGWIDIPRGQVPHFLLSALESQMSWLNIMGVETLPTFVIIPAGIDPDEIIESFFEEIET